MRHDTRSKSLLFKALMMVNAPVATTTYTLRLDHTKASAGGFACILPNTAAGYTLTLEHSDDGVTWTAYTAADGKSASPQAVFEPVTGFQVIDGVPTDVANFIYMSVTNPHGRYSRLKVVNDTDVGHIHITGILSPLKDIPA